MFNLTPEQRDFLLHMGAGLLGGGKNNADALSRGLLMGAQGRNEGMVLRSRDADAKQQRAYMQTRMDEEARQRAEQEKIRGIFSQNTMPGNLAPNDDEGNQMPPAPQGMNMQGLLGGLETAGPQGFAMAQSMRPKPYEPKMAFAPNGQAVDMRALQPGQSFAKPQELPAGMQMGPNGPEPIPGYVEMRRKIAAAGAPSVTTNVMPPREIFKDSLALKKDFDSQPEVKGFKEVQGAWDQISTALQNPSPANDLAASTKYMKLLDPGSVVRESELAMAMKASGALDRMANYHNRLLKGEKLTPQQRQDFYSAGEALYSASKMRFGETVGQYEGIAKQYGLDAQFLPKEKPQEDKQTVTIGGQKREVRKAPNGKSYVKMGDKYYEVQE